MECNKCGSSESKVTDSAKTINHVKRRRKCVDCGNMTTTIELAVENKFIENLQSKIDNVKSDLDSITAEFINLLVTCPTTIKNKRKIR